MGILMYPCPRDNLSSTWPTLTKFGTRLCHMKRKNSIDFHNFSIVISPCRPKQIFSMDILGYLCPCDNLSSTWCIVTKFDMYRFTRWGGRILMIFRIIIEAVFFMVHRWQAYFMTFGTLVFRCCRWPISNLCKCILCICDFNESAEY